MYMTERRKKHIGKFDARWRNKTSLGAVGYVRNGKMAAKRRETEKQRAEPEPRAAEWFERYVRDLNGDDDGLERDDCEHVVDDDEKKESPSSSKCGD
jgi:hypothetical protein